MILTDPLVSVIIPVFNTEKYLTDCISSVINQSYLNLEVILVDDGSTDNCPNICDEFAIRYRKVNVVHKKNGGLSEARNFGIEIARGEYLIFLDSDDLLLRNTIRELINDSLINNSDFVVPDRYYEISEISVKKKEKFHFKNVKTNDPAHFAKEIIIRKGRAWRATGTLYRSSIIFNHNIRFPVGYVSEDIVFNLEYLKYVNNIKIYNNPTLIQNKRTNSISTSFNEKMNEVILFIDKKVESYLTITQDIIDDGIKRKKELLCRNTIVYITQLFSKQCYFDYSQRVKLANEFLSNETVKQAFNIKRISPYFNSCLAIFFFRLMFFLIKRGQFRLSFKLAEFANRCKRI